MTLSKSHILSLSFPRWVMVFVACAVFQGVGWSQMRVYGDDDDYTYATREGVEFGSTSECTEDFHCQPTSTTGQETTN